MKMRVQAQHLQPGDIVGSGEKVLSVYDSVKTPRGKINIQMEGKNKYERSYGRTALWGKYTMINVERKEKVEQ